MTRSELLDHLTVERYGPTGHAKRHLPTVHTLADGGADNEISQARRRKVLCDALDDATPVPAGVAPTHHRPIREAVAA